ncbi:hypothetical protein B0H65DRAFT_568466 [Neurospora tetraspora]|uniref:Uncharacterized protein n=1 Tax=Neurospora tetraspora TaxID=94610 RepID=A0AAE0JL04_9PEZI|nr:hypothetical protein B0H65DRAFT_568466 [Neurospora tetraspora]
MNPVNGVAESLRRVEEEVEQRQSVLRLINLPDKTSEEDYTDKARLLNGLHAVEQLGLIGSEMLENFSIDQFGRIQVHTPGSSCKSFAREFTHVKDTRSARSTLLSLLIELLDDTKKILGVGRPKYPKYFPWFTFFWNVQDLKESKHPIPEPVLEGASTICDSFCNEIRKMQLLAQKTLVDMQLSDIGSVRIRDVCHAFELGDNDWRTIAAHLAKEDRFALKKFVEERVQPSGKLEEFLRTVCRVRKALEDNRGLYLSGFIPEES